MEIWDFLNYAKKWKLILFGGTVVCIVYDIATGAASEAAGLLPALIVALLLLAVDYYYYLHPELRKPKFERKPVDIVGMSHECKFPNGKLRERESVCRKCKEGEEITIKAYTFNGENAYAVMVDRLGADIGVLPAARKAELEAWSELDGLKGRITSINKREETYVDEDDVDEDEVVYYYDVEIELEKQIIVGKKK